MNLRRAVWVVALWAAGGVWGQDVNRGRTPAFECSIQQPEVGGIYVAELWPGGVVPYTFNANVSEEHRQLVLEAMAELESVCGCDFVERTDQADYVRYQNSNNGGNNSWVGKKGGLQVVNMVNWDIPTLLHESIHALGCWHEQQRADRDQYIQVHDENVQGNALGNFSIREGTIVGWYDFDSIMHYDRFAWTTNGLPTISARPEYVQFERRIGRTPGLTSGDRWVLTAMYGGDRPPGAFSPVAPVDGAAVGAGWSASFDWDSSELADTYRLRVADNPGFVSPVIDVQTTESEYQGGSLADGEVYYWTVEAINAFGSTTVWPRETQVLYTGDVPPPVIHVDAAAAPGGDGASWDTAFTDLADALGAGAAAGGAPVEVRIAQGRYTPDRGTGDRGANFELRAGMTVRGGYGGVQNPDDPDATGFVTILDGDLAGDDGPNFENYTDNALHVLTALWQFEAPVVLEDLEIVGGNADGAPGIGFMRRAAGAGVLAERADLRVSGCTIRGNSALSLGSGLGVFDTEALVTGCRFEANRQTSTGFLGGAAGGMSSRWGGRPLSVLDCEFIANTSTQGSGLYMQFVGAARVDRCTFRDNHAGMWGGAMVVYNTQGLDIRSCLFLDNACASDEPGAGEGGVINFYDGVQATVSNTLMAGNSAVSAGGAIWAGLSTDLTIINSTFSLNSAPVGGALHTSDIYGGHSVTSVLNSIVYGNDADEIADVDGASTSAAYSDVKGGFAGFANIDADPQFDGTFSPASGSPANDAGLNGVLDAEIVGDVYGAPRISDDPGAQGGMVIDMGAVEYAACAPDLNGDGLLDLFDFLMFLNLFNAQDERADCLGDGGFDLFDFLCFVNGFNEGC